MMFPVVAANPLEDPPAVLGARRDRLEAADAPLRVRLEVAQSPAVEGGGGLAADKKKPARLSPTTRSYLCFSRLK